MSVSSKSSTRERKECQMKQKERNDVLASEQGVTTCNDKLVANRTCEADRAEPRRCEAFFNV